MLSAAEERPRRRAGRGRTPSRWPSACSVLVAASGRGFARGSHIETNRFYIHAHFFFSSHMCVHPCFPFALRRSCLMLGSSLVRRWRESCPWWPPWRLTSSCALTCSTTASRSRRPRHEHAYCIPYRRHAESLSVPPGTWYATYMEVREFCPARRCRCSLPFSLDRGGEVIRFACLRLLPPNS